MKDSGWLSALFLTIAVSGLCLVVTLVTIREQTRHRNFLETLWKVESRRVQTLLNQMTAKDFPMFAGMQQMTQQNMESQSVSVPAAPFSTTSSEYIPRDDVTEALRLKAFGQPGYGETFYEDPDPDAAMMLSELIGGGQNDMVGREDNE